ncbi:putative ankyrin repeat-containing domain-containing protein [Helianthus annuus]|nr:putative ankyrin repeat-containing domain-containing protein [Helianthus annuus]
MILMANTPHHVAASHNSVEVVRFLLNFAGPETVDLEAKNMHGETPLHMAAKTGCNEAATLLLSDGASTEAKANEGMTPLNHLSETRNEKLRALLNAYLEEKRKRRAIETCSETKTKMDELEKK